MLQDLSTLGIKALGPRRKIVCALQDLKKNKTPISRHGAGTNTIQEVPGTSHQASLGSVAVDTIQGRERFYSPMYN